MSWRTSLSCVQNVETTILQGTGAYGAAALEDLCAEGRNRGVDIQGGSLETAADWLANPSQDRDGLVGPIQLNLSLTAAGDGQEPENGRPRHGGHCACRMFKLI